jgi:uncharacterized repeat protein (TIGR03837 family)
MLWDVFCRVIDNFGDIGVCWRLSTDLAARGQQVRLWVDDASALTWMAPQLRWQDDDTGLPSGVGVPGVTVRSWGDAEQAERVPEPGDVVIEAFGCDPPEAFLRRMNRPAPPAWVNLEYLSAEDYVERSHGLQSPVFSGPAAGLRKHFFYPGFTPRTGGLLRERDLAQRQSDFGEDARLAWLQQRGVPATADCRLVSVFCYATAPLGDWLDALADEALRHTATTRVLLTPGHATQLARAWQRSTSGKRRQALACHELPALAQPEFDHLLWACHLNIVRGEDSAVRALWAGKPHIWHIYPQDDGVHAGKLDAFLDRWLCDAPAPLSSAVRAAWHHFNRLPDTRHPEASPPTSRAGLSATPPPLPHWRQPDGDWACVSRSARLRSCTQGDLTTQLLAFVAPIVTSSG